MFVAVTEPKSVPVGPAFTSKRSTVLPSDGRHLLGLVDRACLVLGPVGLDLADLGDAAGEASSAIRRGRR